MGYDVLTVKEANRNAEPLAPGCLSSSEPVNLDRSYYVSRKLRVNKAEPSDSTEGPPGNNLIHWSEP
jgi:hypothetical protein